MGRCVRFLDTAAHHGTPPRTAPHYVDRRHLVTRRWQLPLLVRHTLPHLHSYSTRTATCAGRTLHCCTLLHAPTPWWHDASACRIVSSPPGGGRSRRCYPRSRRCRSYDHCDAHAKHTGRGAADVRLRRAGAPVVKKSRAAHRAEQPGAKSWSRTTAARRKNTQPGQATS